MPSVTLKKGCMWITLDHDPSDMAVRMLKTDGWTQANVVSMDGGPLPGQADGHITEMLSAYLDQALHGEISGLAVALARPNGRTGVAFFSGSSGHALTAAVSGLFFDVNAYMLECSREDTIEPRPSA